MTPDLINAWCLILNDLSMEELQYGFSQALKVCEDLPAPATIRKLIEARTATKDDYQAEADLEKLEKLIEEWGADRRPNLTGTGLRYAPTLTGALAYALRSIGGWRAFALADRRDARFMRKDFLEAHRRYSRREAIERRAIGRAALALHERRELPDQDERRA